MQSSAPRKQDLNISKISCYFLCVVNKLLIKDMF